MTQKQQDVFEKVIALRHLTRTSGMITKRSQNTLLANLTDTDLAAVSRELQNHAEQNGW